MARSEELRCMTVARLLYLVCGAAPAIASLRGAVAPGVAPVPCLSYRPPPACIIGLVDAIVGKGMRQHERADHAEGPQAEAEAIAFPVNVSVHGFLRSKQSCLQDVETRPAFDAANLSCNAAWPQTGKLQP